MFLSSPATLLIVERASRYLYVYGDETCNRMDAVLVQASVINAAHTTQIRIIEHLDAITL